jgi:hypothetical protein
MPTFPTPEPITVTLDLAVGEVRIRAGERTDTVVDVQPSDATSDDDVKVAGLTRVEHLDGRLLVKVPKLRSWSLRGTGGSVDLTIELPAGSEIHAGAQIGGFDLDGPLGDCRIKTGLGAIRIGQGHALNLKTGIGDITVDRATGHAELTTGSGEVRVRELGAGGVIKNSNGDTWVGRAAGDVRVQAANGDIAVDASRATVVAKSANGDVRLGEVGRGSAVLETKIGDLEVGIPEGTAAWLDLRATAGRIHNALAGAGAPPEPSAASVEVRAHTTVGDVVIRRP